MLPLKKDYLVGEGEYEVSRGDSSGDSDSDSSMKRAFKRVQFTVTDTDNNNNNQMTCKHVRRTNKTNNLNSTNLVKIDRGDIPNGSDIFRQVLNDIQTESSEVTLTDVAKRKTSKQKQMVNARSKPLKSILKK